MLVTIILALAVAGLFSVLIYSGLRTKRLYANYTLVPYRIPVLGHLFEFLADTNKFIFENFAKYGSTFTATILGQRLTFLLDIHDLQAMNKNPHLVFSGDEMVSYIFGSRPIEKDVRQAISQTLHKTIYPQTLQRVETLNDLTAKFLHHFYRTLEKDKSTSSDEWRECGLFELCHRLIFEASTRSLFGDIESSQLKDLETNFLTFNDKFHLFFRGLPQWFYKLFYRQAYQARQEASALLFEERTNESDFVRALREQYQERYADAFSKSDVGAHMMIFFWASLANTIPTMFWVLYYLLTSKHGEIFDELRAEIIAENGEMDKLKLVDSTINETLRLVGNIFLLRCTYNEDGTTLELHDERRLHIHPKDLVCHYPTISHYNETVFPESYTFKHDRFLRFEKIPSSYMPFGNGRSMCPGRFFVRNEMKIVLISLVKEIELQLVDFDGEQKPSFRKECVGTGVMLPDRDVKVRYRYKNQAV